MRRPSRTLVSIAAWLALAFVLAAPSASVAIPYDCSVVDKKATVYANTTVTMSESKSEKTCTFSINGATASQPPNDTRRVVIEGLRALQFGQPHDAQVIAQALPALL